MPTGPHCESIAPPGIESVCSPSPWNRPRESIAPPGIERIRSVPVSANSMESIAPPGIERRDYRALVGVNAYESIAPPGIESQLTRTWRGQIRESIAPPGIESSSPRHSSAREKSNQSHLRVLKVLFCEVGERHDPESIAPPGIESYCNSRYYNFRR